MRTIITTRYGNPDLAADLLEVVEQEDPQPGVDQVRIAVAAAAVNPVDRSLLSGAFETVVGTPFPLGFGWDVTGTVDAVGPGVSTVSVGDAVVGLRDELVGPTGTHATHVVLPADAVAPAPAGVDPAAAATYGLNALTADQALDLLDLPAGRTVLVTGAAGGLGDYLVSLASQRGLQVIAQASATDEYDLRSAGAAELVDRDLDLLSTVRMLRPGGVDAVVDAAHLGLPALQAVADGGSFVAVTDPSAPTAERGVRVTTVHVHHDGARLRLTRAVEEGRLRLRVAQTFALEDAGPAYVRAGSRGLRGRIVLTP